MRPLLCRLSYRAILYPLSIPVRAFALAAPQRASLPSEAPFLTASFALLDFHVSSMHQKCTPLISFSGFTATGSKGRRCWRRRKRRTSLPASGTLRGEKHPADPSSHCAGYATLGVLSLFGSRGVKGSPALGSVPPPRLSRHPALSRPEVGTAL